MKREKSLIRVVAEPLAVAIVLAIAIRAAFPLFSVPSASMEPTLRPGDVIIATRYWARHPVPGHVVVFRHPATSEVMVKRVVAVAGDYVATADGRLQVGSHTVAESYLSPANRTDGIAPQLVPAESYFVLGDNRTGSVDSRVFGAVHESRVIGRARLVLWSGRGRSTAPPENAPAGEQNDAGRGLIRIFKWIE